MKQQTHKQIAIILTSSSKQSIFINISQLIFLSAGSDHILFQINHPSQTKSEVLIFRRRNDKTQMNKHIQEENDMESIYEEIVEQYFGEVHKLRVPRSKYRIANCEEELLIILDELNKKIRENIEQKQIPNEKQAELERYYKWAYISKNIFKDTQYNTFIQFKPKSILPDVYSMSLLQKLCGQCNICLPNLIEMMKNSKPVEKLRWYKKSLYEKRLDKKANLNPLFTFGMATKDFESDFQNPTNFTETKCFKKTPNLSKLEEQKLNPSIMNQLIQNQSALVQILQIQFLFPYSPQLISLDFNFKKLQSHTQVRNLIEKVKNNYTKVINFRDYLEKSNCVSQYLPSGWTNQCTLLLFLMSLTWKDISLIYAASYQKGEVDKQRIYIVDDYLKRLGKVAQNVEKDRLYLSNYVQMKIKEKSFGQQTLQVENKTNFFLESN